ncbi:unnamed protein product, partial [marine sediment metagenome]
FIKSKTGDHFFKKSNLILKNRKAKIIPGN